MSVKFTVLATASVALAALPAWAQDDKPVAPKNDKNTESAVVKVTSAGAAITVVRDAFTGELRAPTADEINYMIEAARAPDESSAADTPSEAAAEPRAFTTEDGAAGIHLGEAAFSLSIARRNPDESLSAVCVTGKVAAHKALASPVSTINTSKELPNE
jgi:hypothetical protein